ncbi:hypothetical protein CBW65_14855 [Tumebacillus avium]|uniref:Uncharacterized protein n=1 Tax=Tumebacillus avium TaxID=1903704 RepID=A0A1Y0IRQ6_9BACL|nr:hypothetical protein [Tumebacillus avium]ARU62135.1 hypothetical protein CBW65_14855 [Tumebacillus avium]
MHLLGDAAITFLILSIVLVTAYRVKKHLHRIEIAVLYVFFSAVLSDVVIVISLNNKFWQIETDGLFIYILNLIHRLIIMPTMAVLFVNDITGRQGLLKKSAVYLKWLLLFLFVAYASVWMDLVEYLRWPFYLSLLEWGLMLALALGAKKLYRWLLKREYGELEEVQP